MLAVLTVLAFVTITPGGEPPQRNAEGETPLQVALRQGERTAVLALLTDTQAAYHETFTRGPGQPTTPLPRQELDQAWQLLLGLMREGPRLASLNFVIGVLAEKRKDLARAELAFERALQASPGNHRAGLELARICALSGRNDEARRHYEHVLAQDPPSAVAENIRAHLDQIGRMDKRFHISVRVDAGAISDDNANVGPQDDTIAVAPLTVGSTIFTELAVAPESQPIDASGAYAAATVEMLYDFGRAGGWGWATDLNYYENWLDVEEEDSRLVKAVFGAKRATKQSLFRGNLYARRIWLGSDPLVDAFGVQPVYLRRFKPGGHALY
jgi:tetratricopeptide (TPR) repeat protein